MKKAIIISILSVILLAMPLVSAIDLEDYPIMFSDEARVIVGKSASAEDVVGAIDIVTALQQRLGKRVQSAVLDTEVIDLESKNSIVVGGPCINSAAAQLMGYPQNCMQGFEMGKGIIQLFEFDNGKYALLAAGTTALDTRRVTTVLANYKDYQLSGMKMDIAGLNMNRVNVEVR